MSTFEQRLIDILGEDYDYDRDIVSPDPAKAFVAVLKEMPSYGHVENNGGTKVYHRAWCPKQELMADITICNSDGVGRFAYAGSEEIPLTPQNENW